MMLFDTLYSKNFPYAVYSIEGGKPMRPHLGNFLGRSDIDGADLSLRSSRPHVPPRSYWIERVIARMRLLRYWLPNICCFCFSVLRYLPWSDERKSYKFDKPGSKGLLGRYYMLLSACRWSALLPWRS
jgi:hypothetical protein